MFTIRRRLDFWQKLAVGLLVLIAFDVETIVSAQFDFDRPPIDYSAAEPQDAIADLARQLERGEIELNWDAQHGWLPDLLQKLKVPVTSQVLVFSKTSLQIRHVSPTQPRALYFSDDVYVGWLPRGDLIELSAVDPQLGPVFYTISNARSRQPKIERDHQRCLTCHATSKTQDVPGYLVRSVFPGPDGHPVYGLGTVTTDHRTPLADRFGGWYVTGTHGAIRHRGNIVADAKGFRAEEQDSAANLTAVPSHAGIERYLTSTSDIVALMVLEHQTQMHNFITRAHYETRLALDYERTMNEALGRPADMRNPVTQRRIAAAAEDLLECLLLSGEAPLASPIRGNSGFVSDYESAGPRDQQGRSLRQLDLQRRLYRYGCSPLIYSEAFAALPTEVWQILRQRLEQILSGNDQSQAFQHLTAEDRRDLREILSETLPDLGRWSRQ